ncbi:hypothetical protein OROMI_010333 [Orobanche minor]
MAEAGEFQQSHLAFLPNMQIGSSFSRAPVPFGSSDLNSQHEGYAALEAMMLANSTPLRMNFSMGIQGTIRNAVDHHVISEPASLANGASNYAQAGPAALRLKRRMVYQDDIAPNSRGWRSFVRGESRDPGFSSSNLANFGHGYTLYDERYQAIGLPVDPHLRIFNATNENDGNQVTESKGLQT